MSYENPEDVMNGQLNETCYCPKDCSEIIYFPDVSYVQMYYYLQRYRSIKETLLLLIVWTNVGKNENESCGI